MFLKNREEIVSWEYEKRISADDDDTKEKRQSREKENTILLFYM